MATKRAQPRPLPPARVTEAQAQKVLMRLLNRERRFVARLGLDTMTVRQEDRMLSTLESAIRRAPFEPIFRSRAERDRAIARCGIVRDHLHRRRLRTLNSKRRGA